MAETYATLAEFWPFYLREHDKATTKALHVVGSLASLAWLVLAVVAAQPWFILAALVTGYGLAWIAHFLVEHNRPATFRYPVKSFLSDWRLVWVTVTGRLPREMRRVGLR